jgi:hypothetical protein
MWSRLGHAAHDIDPTPIA